MGYNTSTFFDHIKYGADQFMARMSDFFGNGVVTPGTSKTTGNFALLFPTTPNMTFSVVGAGVAWALGQRNGFDGVTPITVTIAANSSGNPRIDLVQYGPITTIPNPVTGINQDLSRLTVKQGTPAGSPTQPTPDAGYTPLFAVAVANGATSIVTGNVTDLRVRVPFIGLNGPFLPDVLTTLGDTIYCSANGTPGTAARLAGNTAASLKVLSQTGNGTISAAPVWHTLTLTDSGVAGVGTPNTVMVTDGGGAVLFTNSLPNNIGINISASPFVGLNINCQPTTASGNAQYGVLNQSQLGTTSPPDLYGYSDNMTATVSGGGTTLRHIAVKNATIGGSALSAEYGFETSLSSGSGKFNIYAIGTAPNYFKSNILINVLTAATGLLTVDFASANSQWGASFNDTGALNGTIFIGFRSAGTQIGSITNVTNTGVAYNTTSDYRLKECVFPMGGEFSIQRIMDLNPVTFRFISAPDVIHEGFLAHEVQSVVRTAVTGEKDVFELDADGKPDPSKPIYQQMDRSMLVPLLVAAVRELVQKVARLEAEKEDRK